RDRVVDPEPSRARAAKRGKVRAASERSTDVLGKGADVRALAATDANIHGGRPEIEQFELQDAHAPRLTLDALAATGELVERHAVPLERRMHGGHLLDLALKTSQCLSRLPFRNGNGLFFQDLPLG